MQGFAPADEALLFRQTCPKPFPPVRGLQRMIKTFVSKAAGALARAAYRFVREHGKGPRTPLTDVLIILFRVPPPPPRIRRLRNSLRSNSLRQKSRFGATAPPRPTRGAVDHFILSKLSIGKLPRNRSKHFKTRPR